MLQCLVRIQCASPKYEVVITGAGLLVVVSRRIRWQNGVHSRRRAQGSAWWHKSYVIPRNRFVPTWSEVFNDGHDKQDCLFMNHEVSESASVASFVWVKCSVSAEVGRSVRPKNSEYQSVDNLDYNILVICYKWVWPWFKETWLKV